MNEENAVNRFFECSKANDISGCLEALKNISQARLNRQDADGCTMLISSVISRDLCAVNALLDDARSDWTIEEYRSGKSAEALALEYPEEHPLHRAFADRRYPDFIWRNGERIHRANIYERIMDGTIQVNRGCFDMLLGDCYRAKLVANGKITREQFESWLDPKMLHWEGQITLLIEDEQYGRKIIDWDYIRESASADDWLMFLPYIPEYADRADWDKLVREGSPCHWRDCVEAAPQLKARYPESLQAKHGLLTKYDDRSLLFNFHSACERNDVEVVKAHLERSSGRRLNENVYFPMPPGFILRLPLEIAVENNAADCVELLLECGADPDAVSRSKSANGKTPRELAAGTAIQEIFEKWDQTHRKTACDQQK